MKSYELATISTPGGLSVDSLPDYYKSDIRVFNAWNKGRSISPETLKEYFSEMRETRSVSTLQKYRSALKYSIMSNFGNNITLLQRAEIDQVFKQLKPGRPDVSVNPDKTLTKQDLERIKKNAGEKTVCLIQTLFETAARVSELNHIKISDCTVQGAGVIVNIAHGKGNKARAVNMSLKAYELIKRIYAGKTYLFENKKTGNPIRTETIYKLLKAAGRYTDKHLTPHVMRHTWATLSLEALQIDAVSKYLGHASTATTAAFYLHGKASMADILAVNQLNCAM